MRRALRTVLAGVAVLLLVVFVAAVVLNGTYYGRERARRLALDAVRQLINGEIVVGRIDGNLLDRFELVDVQINDRQGQPFIVADRIRARVALAPLISKRIEIHSVELERPIVTVSKVPGGDWNYEEIFTPTDTAPREGGPGFGSWVDLRGVVIRDGTLIVRQPYISDQPQTRTVGDSTALPLAGETRLRVERVGSGLQQVMEFRDIDARIPRLVWAHPDSSAIAFRIAELSMQATPLQAPDVVVTQFEGDVRIVEDTVAVRDVELRLPESTIAGALTYHIAAGDLELDLRSDTLALRDVQALHPGLPDEGGGRLDLKATIRDTATSVYEFTNARLRIGESRITGNAGIAVNRDRVELRETDLRLTRFTTDLVEALLPGFQARIPGYYTGTARASGAPERLRTEINGTFDADRHAPFGITARGVIGTGRFTTAENLRVTLRSVPVSLAREFVTDLPLGGSANVDAVISGSTGSRFTGAATVRYREEGSTSTLVAEGSVAPSDSMRMDLDVRLTPVSLELVQRFNPDFDLRGEVRGTGKVVGTLANLRPTLDLELPSGAARFDGTFDLASDERAYQAQLRLMGVDIQAIAPTLPQTALNGVVAIDGRGTTLPTMDAQVSVNLRDFVFDSTRVADAILMGRASDGLLHVDSLRARTAFGVVTGNGSFGLVAGKEGSLEYGVELTSVAGLERWIAVRDTSVVRSRPLARLRAARRARLDSLRAVGDTATISAILARRQDRRRAPVRLPDVYVTEAVARDSLGGALSVKGTLQGSVQRFTARGRAEINHLVYSGTEVGSGTVDFTWADVRTPEVLLTAEAGVDSLRVSGFAFDSTHVEATYRDGSGDVNLSLFPGDTAMYQLRARYAIRTDEGEVALQEVNLRFDSLSWRSTRASTISWKGQGITVDSLELRPTSGNGRIFVHGEVPDRDPGTFIVRVENVRVAPWVTLLQSDVPLDGIATFSADVEGTRTNPRITGNVALAEARFRDVPFPEVRSEFSYGNRQLRFTGDLRRATGSVLAQLRGEMPIDLSMGDSIVNRKLPGQVTLELQGDSIPLAPIAEFVEEFSLVTGEARGRVAMVGTWERLRYEGDVFMTIPQLGLRTPGVTFTNTFVHAYMFDDRLVIDSLLGYSGGPVRARGSILLGRIDRPVLDIDVVADETRVLDNYRGELVVSSQLALRGPIDTLAVGGTVDVMHGIIRIPDPEQLNLINTGDPVLLAVVDSSLAAELEIAPPSPILENANVNVRLRVHRGTWARSREANVEVYGDLAILRSTGDEELAITGALLSDYGDYELYGRRFRVTRGSARFTGSMSNPVLQLIATHEVRQAGRAPFDIQVTIGGTLERPNVSLSSAAQPTLNQSDLISFLAFGQSSTSLLQFEGSGLEGGGLSGSSLAGNVASLASRQLGAVALGALLDDLESTLSERSAFDVLKIRPADLPANLSLGAVSTVARGTQIEIGKYINRNTFFVGQIRPTLAVPGATLEHRFGSQWRLRTSLETRYRPLPPSLTSGLQPRMHQVIGALIRWTRSW